MDRTDDAIEMRVSGLAADPLTNSPILMLSNRRRDITLPIWVGLVEASAIAVELEDLDVGRPMTHDLLRELIECLGGRLVRVEINDLRDNTYFASVLVESGDVIHAVDSRPSDAVALALRCDVPIYVSRVVLEKAARLDIDVSALSVAEGAQWSEVLASSSPPDFGKYRM